MESVFCRSANIRYLFAIFLVLFIPFSYAIQTPAKPLIFIIATGGTIAGTANSQTSTTYKAGSLTAQQLIASVPGLDRNADIKYIQLYNKDSGNITISDWITLSNQVNKLLEDPKISGIVITHGTDTLEETAYLLDLTVKSNKPVVLVGSMRAATSLSADGPLNLFNAIAVATNKLSVGRGVLVAMDEKIYAARDVTKTNTTSVETFQAPNSGKIGTVFMGDVKYNSEVERGHTLTTPFKITTATISLPKVAIIYQYVGIDENMLLNILKDDSIKGIVLAGMGDGNIPNYEDIFIKEAIKKGIVVVRASRTGSGSNSANYNNLDTIYGTIPADDLSPTKARILLMLSLTLTNKPYIISQYFSKY